MMKKLLMVVLALTVTSAANAATRSFQQGFDYFGTFDRPYMWNGDDSNDSDTGSQVEFDMPTNDDPNPRYAHIRFADVFGAGPDQVPLGAPITSATMTLNITNNFNFATMYRLLDTIDNRPQGGGTTAADIGGPNRMDAPGVAGSYYDDTTGAFSGNDPGTGLLDFDVTDIVAAWSAGATNHGVVLLGGTDDGGAFSSSENAPAPLFNASRPKLTIEFIPEPSTFAMVSISALGLGLVRRRRLVN